MKESKYVQKISNDEIKDLNIDVIYYLLVDIKKYIKKLYSNTFIDDAKKWNLNMLEIRNLNIIFHKQKNNKNNYILWKELSKDVDKGFLSRIIKSLEAKDYIRIDKTMLHNQIIYFTENGEKVARQIYQKNIEIWNNILNKFEKNENKEFIKFLTKLKGVIESEK